MFYVQNFIKTIVDYFQVEYGGHVFLLGYMSLVVSEKEREKAIPYVHANSFYLPTVSSSWFFTVMA